MNQRRSRSRSRTLAEDARAVAFDAERARFPISSSRASHSAERKQADSADDVSGDEDDAVAGHHGETPMMSDVDAQRQALTTFKVRGRGAHGLVHEVGGVAYKTFLSGHTAITEVRHLWRMAEQAEAVLRLCGVVHAELIAAPATLFVGERKGCPICMRLVASKEIDIGVKDAIQELAQEEHFHVKMPAYEGDVHALFARIDAQFAADPDDALKRKLRVVCRLVDMMHCLTLRTDWSAVDAKTENALYRTVPVKTGIANVLPEADVEIALGDIGAFCFVRDTQLLSTFENPCVLVPMCTAWLNVFATVVFMLEALGDEQILDVIGGSVRQCVRALAVIGDMIKNPARGTVRARLVRVVGLTWQSINAGWDAVSEGSLRQQRRAAIEQFNWTGLKEALRELCDV